MTLFNFVPLGYGGCRPVAQPQAGLPAGVQPAKGTHYVRICLLNIDRTSDLAEGQHDTLRRIAALGFDHVLLSGWPVIVPDRGDPLSSLAAVSADCARHGLAPLLDLSLDRYPENGATIDPAWIDHDATRFSPHDTDNHLPGLRLRWHTPAVAAGLVDWWATQLRAALAAGVSGFCLRAPARVPGRHWATLTATLRADAAGPLKTRPLFLAWTPGLTPAQLDDLIPGQFDGAFCSLPWWDFRSAWLTEEIARLRPFGRVLAAPSQSPASQDALSARRALWTAAAIGDGVLVPAGFETGGTQARDPLADDGGARDGAPYDITHEVLQANAWLATRPLAPAVSVRLLSGPDAALTVLARLQAPDVGGGGSDAPPESALTIVVNPDTQEPGTLGLDRVLAALPRPAARLELSDGGPGGNLDFGAALDALADITLAPADIRVYRAVPAPAGPAARLPQAGDAVSASGLGSVVAALEAPRIAIEAVEPACDGGRFPVRRVVGERVEVSADIWMDGHDKLAAAVLWRAPGQETWQEAPMRHLVNDRWYGSFPLVALGRHTFTVEAWRDAFASWLDEVGKKRAAGVDITLEIEEGARLVADALMPAQGDGPPPDSELAALVDELTASAGDDAARLEILLSPRTAAGMQAAMQTPAGRPFASRHPLPMPVEAERLASRFASWYEMFPRSASEDENRHGTFDDVIARLPAIRAMGFDVLYFTPIHPIGKTHRKGRNNSLRAQPDDPGSPYAIGAEDGGHDALHAQLGTFEDFERLRVAAAAAGLELALDFAIQCSLDHPWLRQHPEWFAHRPDGSLRYAENPPKKYEDIVNVDFYAAAPAAAALWQALRDVVMFWVQRGVRIFRVDNPHTKPLPFWEWMIADVRARYPDTIFLAEAFTRPKMMARLAKLGFSQSYTYFTWRNTRAELAEYMTELTQTPLREFFRPHFFVNTPDINPYFLHRGGRPAFLIRAALATLLSGLWGMYSGFELCESAPLVLDGKVREEYLDSEKYQLRARNRHAPGNIVAEITRLNQIRLGHPALQSHLGLRIYPAGNDAVLYFARFVPGIGSTFGDDVLLAAISMDPFAAQEASVEIPLWEWGLADHGSVAVQDLMDEHRFAWHGKCQRIRLDPVRLPFALWHVTPIGRPARREAVPAVAPDPHGA
ncbi:alpha-1,4-glucan--maltose-1-phosphate maltosyltransferase [Cupriavidus sp. WKF15]|uniref:alpha-1,4-glucan--maltose-1-phosphate maltosyltransferase n=1 Tax=Cupriavidus sp. WKF15 TaxID=3032282 RepID=UPI0023E1E829|nr:alpha-1,4-glucan--maltose-1-phosphate maltosyltransferase [Cupriavidus sp. WKF15]WER48521.1 alpha-1,4-glucan--maltose-1-phosphate maltosyltransferase [Cupriavidus sp. WKF15]